MATATVIAQGVSAVLVIGVLCRMRGSCRLFLKRLQLEKKSLKEMMKIGIPAGLQSALFSISNILIQFTINTFGSIAMAGNTAASNLEGFVYTSMNAFYQTAITFTGQNYGAKKFKRIGKIALIWRSVCAIN